MLTCSEKDHITKLFILWSYLTSITSDLSTKPKKFVFIILFIFLDSII